MSAGDEASGLLAQARPRVRVVLAGGARLGPGKIDLLDAISRTGSISAAGRELGMSYRRSWLLIDAVNHMFTQPVVTASVGGAQGGGAEVTEFGKALVAAYRRIEARTHAAILEELAPFDMALAAPGAEGEQNMPAGED